MLPALTDAVVSAFRGARNALKESGPTELNIAGRGEEKDVSGGFMLSDDLAKMARIYPSIGRVLLGGAPTWSGEAISLQSALNHSVVWACNRLISETQGATPLVMQQQKGNSVQAATEHPMYFGLLHAPNDEMSAMSFQETRTSHCALQGNAFAQIVRRSGTGTAIQLNALDPSQVVMDRDRQQRIVYIIKQSPDGVAGNNDKTYTLQPGKPQDILHIRGLGWDGLRGYSVIHMARQSIGTAIAIEKNVASFYASGARVPYHLEKARPFQNDEQFREFQTKWENTYAVAHRVPILEGEIKYVKDGMSAVDQQMLESRLFDIHEVCRWFLMSPHLVGDLSRATFSNIEQLALEFVKVTMGPWFNRWEKDLWRCVLTPDEKAQGYQFKHDITDLTSGALLDRMNAYSIGLQNGVYNPNNVLKFLGMNPFEGGDAHHIQLNMQTLQKDGTTTPPATPSAEQTPAKISE